MYNDDKRVPEVLVDFGADIFASSNDKISVFKLAKMYDADPALINYIIKQAKIKKAAMDAAKVKVK